MGYAWLLAFALFILTLTLRSLRSKYWWFVGFLAVIASQMLVVYFWTDAKFGTLANLLVLFTAILGYSRFNFSQKLKAERRHLLEQAQPLKQQKINTEDLKGLPSIVQKWLKFSGATDTPNVSNVYLTQELQLKLRPEQKDWKPGNAEQYFTVQPPAFHWDIQTEMNALLPVVGRDKFENGKGEMYIKLLSLLPVANTKQHEKVHQATLQRFLAEMVWFPSACLSPYLQWEAIDERSAKATMEYQGTKGSGIFYFDATGQFERFVAMRFKDVTDTSPKEWTVIAKKTEERNGVKIPTECEAIWQLETGAWTWLQLKIKHIEYNVDRKS